MDQKYMDVQDASDYMKISQKCLYYLVTQNAIPRIRVGRKLLFDRADIDVWLSDRKVLPASKQVKKASK